MIYRLLGGVSLLMGGIFALVTVLVLLPFLNNFNTSLLVLAAIFAIFAWVFLAIGWQLTHPPRSKGGPPEEEVTEEQAVSEEPPAPSPLHDGHAASVSGQEAKELRKHHLRSPRTF